MPVFVIYYFLLRIINIFCFGFYFSSLLNTNGVIVVKENIAQTKEGEIDSEDSSITRSFVSFCNIFQRANLKCVAKKTQRNFPQELYLVEMFALKPVDISE